MGSHHHSDVKVWYRNRFYPGGILSEMREDKKKLRLARDMKKIEEEGTFVSLP
jgi:hypothetical protein